MLKPAEKTGNVAETLLSKEKSCGLGGSLLPHRRDEVNHCELVGIANSVGTRLKLEP
jgi:hypothetical protein